MSLPPFNPIGVPPRQEIHVTIDLPGLVQAIALLARIENHLLRIETQQGKLMATSQDILDLLSKIDDATTAIGTEVQAVADRIQSLINQLSGGVSPADAERIRAAAQAEVTKLSAVSDQLVQLGQDPQNPVPTP